MSDSEAAGELIEAEREAAERSSPRGPAGAAEEPAAAGEGAEAATGAAEEAAEAAGEAEAASKEAAAAGDAAASDSSASSGGGKGAEEGKWDSEAEDPASESFYRLEQQFRVEEWYPALKEHALPCLIVPLTWRDAAVMIASSLAHAAQDPSESVRALDKLAESQGYAALAAHVDLVHELLAESGWGAAQLELAQRLDSEVEAGMAAAAEGSGASTSSGFFFRLSELSPKDAPLWKSRMRSSLYHRLVARRAKVAATRKASAARQNEHLTAIFGASSEAMRCESGMDALSLVLHSDRVRRLLLRALHYQSKEDFQLSAVLRPWVDIPLSAEFRVFVYAGKLTAVSQSQTQVFFPDLLQRKDKELSYIASFVERLLPSLPYDNAVLDVAVLPKLGVKLVEVNPWARSTSAALFDWEQDWPQLSGELPVTLRILEEPLAPLKAPLWEDIVQETWQDVQDDYPDVRGHADGEDAPDDSDADAVSSSTCSTCFVM
eukprot:PLAT5797.1.p1 GENE.PLAT5797.1~~PLAT5797.1.p1  ORF type:complete len:505 (-),score=230.03 PLAT5797.1:171-1643(-)